MYVYHASDRPMLMNAGRCGHHVLALLQITHRRSTAYRFVASEALYTCCMNVFFGARIEDPIRHYKSL